MTQLGMFVFITLMLRLLLPSPFLALFFCSSFACFAPNLLIFLPFCAHIWIPRSVHLPGSYEGGRNRLLRKVLPFDLILHVTTEVFDHGLQNIHLISTFKQPEIKDKG
jgi:hypothetical protein